MCILLGVCSLRSTSISSNSIVVVVLDIIFNKQLLNKCSFVSSQYFACFITP